MSIYTPMITSTSIATNIFMATRNTSTNTPTPTPMSIHTNISMNMITTAER